MFPLGSANAQKDPRETNQSTVSLKSLQSRPYNVYRLIRIDFVAKPHRAMVTAVVDIEALGNR